MANIKDKLNNIKNALFGKDVRDSIHDGIDAINKEVEGTTKEQQKLSDTFKNLTINAGNSNAEIVAARGSKEWLPDRLDENEEKISVLDSQIKDKANINEIVKRGYGTLSDFDEETRAILQGLDSGNINAVLGPGNVIPKNLSYDTIKNQNSILPTDEESYVRGTLNEGVLNPSNYSRIASEDLIKIKPSSYFDIIAYSDIYKISYEVYDKNENYLRWVNYTHTSKTDKFNENEYYIRLLIAKVDETIFTPADYCSSLNFSMKENIQNKIDDLKSDINNVNKKSFKIGTYNTGNFYNGVKPGIPNNAIDDQVLKIKRTTLKEKCDILCCQEFNYFIDENNSINAYDKAFAYLFPYKFWGGSEQIIYSSIATLSKIQLTTNLHQWIGDDRSLLHSIVSVNGKDIHILNCHLSWSDLSIRTQQIQKCITEMKKYEYVVLCGDFNVLSANEFNTFTVNGFNLANCGYFGEFNTWGNFGSNVQAFRAIDNIIYSDNLQLLDISINDDDISDHSIFMCEFEVK